MPTRRRIERGFLPRDQPSEQAALERERAAQVAGWLISEHCTTWGHLEGGHAAPVYHDEPITVAAAKDAGVVSQDGDDSVDDLLLSVHVRILISQVRLVAGHQPDPKDDARHVRHGRRARISAPSGCAVERPATTKAPS